MTKHMHLDYGAHVPIAIQNPIANLARKMPRNMCSRLKNKAVKMV